MAICSQCNQEMSGEGVSCNGDPIEFLDGKLLRPVRFEREVLDVDRWLEQWERLKTPDDTKEEALIRYAKYARGHCSDCNCPNGGFHHPGCGNEISPKCGGQLIACECLTGGDLNLETKIVHAASDYKLACENSEFTEERGGVDKLKSELFSLLDEWSGE